MKPEASAVFAGVDDETGVSPAHYVATVSRHRRWLLGGLGLGLVGAVVYLLVAEPLYQSETTLLVKLATPATAIPSTTSIMSALTSTGSSGKLGTEVEILQSQSRLAYTTRFVACQQVVEAVTGRQVLLIGALTVGAPAERPPRPGAMVPPAIREALTADVTRLCGILPPLEAVEFLAACALPNLPGVWPPGVDAIQTLVESKLSASEVARLRQTLEQHLPTLEQACLDNLIDVRPSNLRDTDIIAVRAQSPDPDVAADFANALAQEYIWYTQMAASAGTKRDIESVNRMITELTPELAGKRSELVRLMSDEGVANVSAALTSAVAQADKLADLYQTLSGSLEADRRALGDLQTAVRRQEGATVSARQVSTPNPALVTLRDRLASLEQDRAALLKTVTEAHPEVAALDARIEEVKRRVEEELSEPVVSEVTGTDPLGAELRRQLVQKQVQVAGDEVRLQALAERVAASRKELNAFPQKERRIASLEQELEVGQRNYLALVERKQALTLSQIMEDTSVEVLDPALPSADPLKPRKAQVLVLGALLGTLGSFALALLLDLAANAVKSRSELEELIGHRPVFAEIPATGGGWRAAVGAEDGDPAAEAFRSLRAAVQAALPGEGPHVLLVAAPSGVEDRTSVIGGLAAAYGASGRRTVILETDLHEPDLAERSGLSSEAGFAGWLEGDCELEDAIQDTGLEHVGAVVAGPATSRAARLVESPRLRELIDSLRRRADVIILAAPAASREADIRVLAPLADGALLVADAGRSARPAVSRAAALLEETSRLFLGVALNRTGGR